MHKSLFVIAALGSLALASPAMAAHELPPGDSGSPFAMPLTPTGALLADTGLQSVSRTQSGTTLNTTMRSAVYRMGEFLDFYYQITNLGTSNTSINELTFSSFAGFDLSSTGTGAWQQLGAFGVFTDGVEMADSARRGPDGSVIGANFGTNLFNDVDAGTNSLLNPGETSSIFQIRTRASNFQLGTFTAQNGIGLTGMGFAPAAAVPEPGTWMMMLLGIGMIGGALRSRKKKNLNAQLAF